MSPEAFSFVVVDALDAERGVAEVEFSEGFTGELPAWWLPEVTEGAAYAVRRDGPALTFQLYPGGARALRERSKQALLDFQDEFGQDEVGPDGGPSS